MPSQFYLLISYIIFTYILGLLTCLLLFKDIFKKNNLFINLGLSWLFGITVLTIIYFFLAFTNNLAFINQKNFVIFGAVALLAVILILLKYLRIESIKLNFFNLITLSFIIVFLFPIISRSLLSYQDGWDPIAIWFLKAKVFFYSKGLWDNEFFKMAFYEYSHKAYPIGLPLLIAGFYRIINNPNDQIVQLYLLSFYLNIIFVFYGFMRSYCKNLSPIISLLLTLSLFMLPNYAIYAFSGYADVPLSLIILLTAVFFIRLINEEDMRLVFNYIGIIFILNTSGMMMKNEGCSFFVITIFLSFLVLLFKKNFFKVNLPTRKLIPVIIVFLACFLPIIMWEYYKQKYNISLDLEKVKIYANMFSRIKIIANSYINEVTNVNKYSLSLIIIFIISILTNTYFIINKKYKLILPLLIIILQVLIYTIVYLITPLPLQYHLHSSAERLLLHVLPAFFLITAYQLDSITASLQKYKN